MAALRAGVKTVLIPADNEPDLDEIDQSVRECLNFITTDNIDDVLNVALDFSKANKTAKKSNVMPALTKGQSKQQSTVRNTIKH